MYLTIAPGSCITVYMMNDNEKRKRLETAIRNRSFMEKLLRVARRYAGEHGADDARSRGILNAVENLSTFDPAKGTMEGWTLQIVANAAKNNRRDRRKKGEVTSVAGDDGEVVSPLDGVAGGEDAAGSVAIRQAINLLREEDRRFILLIMEGHTQQDAGAVVGWLSLIHI